MVGYLLGLCNVDPLQYSPAVRAVHGPERATRCPISISISARTAGRGIIEYVRKKYGHVAQIVTFGTLAAKAACKDVARVLGIDIAVVERSSPALIPGIPGMTIDKAMATGRRSCAR